jgi:putative ABC transport system permease protein
MMNRLLPYLLQFILQPSRRLLTLLRRRRYEREMEEEMRFHLEMQIGQNLEAGMGAEEARYAARRQFGNQTWLKEASREMWSLNSIETLIQDLRYGVRILIKNPGFAFVAVLTLALGIGANTAIFSVVNAVLIKPLPYREPDRVVQFWETNPLKNWTQETGAPVAPANLFDWQKQNQAFEDIAAYVYFNMKSGPNGLQMESDGEPDRIKTLYVTGNIFSVLGVNAMIGRALREEETWEGRHTVAVLSYGLWQRRFSADPKIVGRKIRLSGLDREVVGVMPPDFYFPSKEAEVWIPMGWNYAEIAKLRGTHFLVAIGRLKPGVTLDLARSEMTAIASRLEQQYPESNKQMSVGLGPLRERIVSNVQLPLIMFLVAVAFVLLIACANVVNLLLSRSAARSREVAIRSALGAGRGRIVRQLLTESLLLAITGGAIGLLLAGWLKDLLVAFSPGDIPRLDEVRLDWRVLGFTVGITLLTTLLTCLAPALQSSKPDLTSSLKEGGQKGYVGQGGRMRGALVIAEIALALVLVAGAGLMIRSLSLLRQVNPGFDPNNVLSLSVSLPESKYDGARAQAFFGQAEQRIRRLPGVIAVGSTTVPALKGFGWTSSATIEGWPPEDDVSEVRHKVITPDYFRAMGIKLLRGRFFNESDNEKSQPVIIVNDTFARRHFPGEDPIGKRVKFLQAPWRMIIGVVNDEKQDGLGAKVDHEAYRPLLQGAQSDMTFMVRTTTDPQSLVGAIREEIRALDRSLPLYDIKTMRVAIYESLARERFITLLLIVFAALALALASIGVYGVMSYSVTQRSREIGVRIALGAQTGDVLKLIVAQGGELAAVGVAIGLISAFALTRLMKTLLFGVSATDPLTFVAVSLLLSIMALLACYIPARRATKVDPLVSLRVE